MAIYFNYIYTVAIPINPAVQMKNVVKVMEMRVPNIAYRLIVPKCLKKGY